MHLLCVDQTILSLSYLKIGQELKILLWVQTRSMMEAPTNHTQNPESLFEELKFSLELPVIDEK